MSIQADIDRGREIVKQIEALKKELKGINERIQAAALKGPHLPLEDAAREGRQYRARGSSVVVPVVITADSLVQSFQADSPLHVAIEKAAGSREQLLKFFAPSTKWEITEEDGQKFRELAVAELGAAAPRFITACVAKNAAGIAKNKIVIAWDREEAPKTTPEVAA